MPELTAQGKPQDKERNLEESGASVGSSLSKKQSSSYGPDQQPSARRGQSGRRETRKLPLWTVAASSLVLLVTVGFVAAQVGAFGTDLDEGSTASDSSEGSEVAGPAETSLSGPLADLAAMGAVRLGMLNEAPYAYVNEEGRLTGVGPEVAGAVLEEVGITEIEPVIVEWSDLIDGLTRGDFDVIAAGLTITGERAARISFTDPHYCFLTSILVPEGNPLGLTDLGSLSASDAEVGVPFGYIEELYLEWAGVPDRRIQRIEREVLGEALVSGEVDAVVGPMGLISSHADELDGYEVAAFPVLDRSGSPLYECAAFGFADVELRDQFNSILVDLKGRGVVVEIVEEHLGEPRAAEVAENLTVNEVLSHSLDEAFGG